DHGTLRGPLGCARGCAGENSRQVECSLISRFASRQARERSSPLRPEVEAQLAPFLQTLAQASQAVLLVDYDGTLAPFHADRNQAYPYPGVLLLLREFVRNGRTRVIVVSGREAGEILPLLNIHPRPEVWGIHGLQR